MGFPVAYGGMMAKLLVWLALVMGAAQALWSFLTPSKEEQASSTTEDRMDDEDYGGRYPLINSPFFHTMPEEEDEMAEVEMADMVEMAVVERVVAYTTVNPKEEEEEEEEKVEEEGGGCCAVCLCEFLPVVHYRPVGRLPRCSHVFHRECIQQWVHHGHRTCPLCRTSFALTPRSTMTSIGFEPTNRVRTQLQSLHAR